MKLQLPSSVSSLADVMALSLEVREFAKWFSHVSVKMHVTGSQVPSPPPQSDAARELIDGLLAAKNLNQASLDEMVTALEAYKTGAPSMTITLAAPAPGALRQELVTWARQNLAPNMLINFKFNATLLGGMVVRVGSHIFDWSFRRAILAERYKFAEVLRRV